MRAVYAREKGAHLVEEQNGYKGCYIDSLRVLAGHTTNRAPVVDFCTVFEAHVYDFTLESGMYSVTAVLNSKFRNRE
jgi:hypothetical protein